MNFASVFRRFAFSLAALLGLGQFAELRAQTDEILFFGPITFERVPYYGGDFLRDLRFAVIDTRTTGDPRGFRIDIHLSTDGIFGNDDDMLFYIDGGVISPGEVVEFGPINVHIPGNFAGTYFFVAQVRWPTPELSNSRVYAPRDISRLTILPSTFPETTAVSVNPNTGFTGNNASDLPSMSRDGRYVVFASDASDLVPGDTNNVRDIFVRDTQTNEVTRVSVSSGGIQANGASDNPAISADGRYVVFQSNATNLVQGDTNGVTDIFLHDRATRLTTRVSTSSAGQQGNQASLLPSVSEGGRFVVFESGATNFSPLATNRVVQVYLKDTATGTLTLLSQANNAAGNLESNTARISADGRYVVFSTRASNLLPGDTNGFRDIVRAQNPILWGAAHLDAVSTPDPATGTSLAGNNGDSYHPALNRDGSVVVFASDASNLVIGDTNLVEGPGGVPTPSRFTDIFLRDFNTGALELISRTHTGESANERSEWPTLSDDGQIVAFETRATNLIYPTRTRSDGVQITNIYEDPIWRFSDTNNSADIYLVRRYLPDNSELRVERVSVNRFGQQTLFLLGAPDVPSSRRPALSADGRYIVFASDAANTAGLYHGATNIIHFDNNSARDVFLRDLNLDSFPPGTGRHPPQVTLITPVNGAQLAANFPITLSASATAGSGRILRVDFYVNGTLVGSDTTAPYTGTWLPPTTGTYNVQANVFDEFGLQGASNTAVVAVRDNVPALPDIAVAALSVVAQPYRRGADLPVTVTLVNAGTQPIVINDSSNIVVEVRLSVDRTIGNADDLVLGTLPLNTGIIAGGTLTLNGTFRVPNNAPLGSYYLAAIADSTKRLTEADETNNTTVTEAPVVRVTSNFAGYYSGGLGAGGTQGFVTLWVRDDGTAAFLGYNRTLGHPYHQVLLNVGNNGRFSFTDTISQASASGEVRADGSLAGSIAGVAFSGQRRPVAGAFTDAAGAYSGIVGSTGTAHALVSPDGHLSLIFSGSPTDGGTTSLLAGNSFSVSTLGGALTTGTIQTATRDIRGTYATPGQAATALDMVGDNSVAKRLVNLSTRARVGTGEDVMIAGFIIEGTEPLTVLIKAVGPSLRPHGISDPLENPHLALFRGQSKITENDNWIDSPDYAAINALPWRPGDLAESAILRTLAPGAYTAIVSGVGNTTGVALVEVFQVNPSAGSRLVNLSTRARVGTGDDVVIAGFIVDGIAPKKLLVRGIGPSLAQHQVAGVLANPRLRILPLGGGSVLGENDNWSFGPTAADVTGSGRAPANVLESALTIFLPPGAYTAILEGVDDGTGVGLVEIFEGQE
jgi:Tol biopolymer transport system component